MMQLLGWLGFLLLIATLVPFILRRCGINSATYNLFSRNHHLLALSSLAVLTLHGILALTWHGRGWGARAHIDANAFSGVLSWLALFAICLLALQSYRRKPFPRTHCRIVVLLVILIAVHII